MNRKLALLAGINLIAFGCSGASEGGDTPERAAEELYAGIDAGWVLSNSLTGACPANALSFNSSGGINCVTNTGTGTYRVDFPGLGGGGGNVQVVAYGPGSERCKVSSWSSLVGTLRAYVACHTAAGVPENSRFTATFYRSSITVGYGAYLWWSGSSAPAAYQENSTGATNTVTSSGTGAYLAVLPGQYVSSDGGSVMVTAYGTTGHHCKLLNWRPDRTGSDLNVQVRCFDAAGAPADSAFTLSYWVESAFGNESGYLWANEETNLGPYTPDLGYQYVTYNLIASAGSAATGVYWATYPELTPTVSTAQVSAYGAGSAYCKLRKWLGTPPSNTTVTVACYDTAGLLTNSKYVERFLTDQDIVL